VIRASDGVVICLCLLGAAAFLGLFYDDLNRSLSRLNEEPVGFIAFKSRAALRRFQDRVIWDRLRKESPVYNGDFIRTADRSEAAVSFPGGDLIGIAANSLIRIFVDEGVPQIDFTRGDISIYAGETGSLVSFGGNRLKVAAGAAVSLDTGTGDGGSVKLQVLRGNASLITPAEEREAAAGEALILNVGGIESGENVLPVAAQVSVLEPPPAARFLTPVNAAVPVKFSWNPPQGSGEKRARIEIARDRNFTRPLTVWENSPETPADTSGTAEIPPGTWWWRVSFPESAGTGGEELPAVGQLTVVHSPPPEPVFPVPEAVYYYQAESPELRFQWKALDDAAYYLLEVADNPDMANPALQTEVRYNSLVYSQLPEGQWYWRVTPVFSVAYRGMVPVSAAVPFTISRGDPPGLIAPGTALAGEFPEAVETEPVPEAALVPPAEPPKTAAVEPPPPPPRRAAVVEPPPRPEAVVDREDRKSVV
jgi:hypothetical protein